MFNAEGDIRAIFEAKTGTVKTLSFRSSVELEVKKVLNPNAASAGYVRRRDYGPLADLVGKLKIGGRVEDKVR